MNFPILKNNCYFSMPIDFSLKAKVLKNYVCIYFHLYSNPIQYRCLPHLANILPKPTMVSLLVPVNCYHHSLTCSSKCTWHAYSCSLLDTCSSSVFQGGILHLLLSHWFLLLICCANSIPFVNLITSKI